MAITDATPEQPSSSGSFWKSILKQLLLALFIGGVVLALYLIVVNSEKEDKWVNKYAYTDKTGSYLGIIKGKGRSSKSGNQVYFVQEPTGAVIEISVGYVEVRDKPPKYD